MFEELEKTLLAMNRRLDELSGKIDGISLAPSKLTYDAIELAEILGYGKKTERIDALRKDGLLQGIRTGRKYIYPTSEVEAFLKKTVGHDIHDEAGRAAAYVSAERNKKRNGE